MRRELFLAEQSVRQLKDQVQEKDRRVQENSRFAEGTYNQCKAQLEEMNAEKERLQKELQHLKQQIRTVKVDFDGLWLCYLWFVYDEAKKLEERYQQGGGAPGYADRSKGETQKEIKLRARFAAYSEKDPEQEGIQPLGSCSFVTQEAQERVN